MAHHAIVLKNYFPKKNKVTIFHQTFGKINFFIDEKHDAAKLCNGALIFCEVIKKRSTYQFLAIDPYFVPFQDDDLYDLYFIHDILKICLQFMPDQLAMNEVFYLVMSMYEQLALFHGCKQHMFLLKLFLCLGIFPENKTLYQQVMQGSHVHSDENEALLQQGLRYCWNSDVNYS